MIRVGTIKSSFDTLLQEGEYSKEEKKAKEAAEQMNPGLKEEAVAAA